MSRRIKAPADGGQEVATTTPELLSRGRYSLYRPTDGGFHLAYRPEGAEEDQHMVIPAKIVRLAEAAAAGGGGPLAMLRGLIGG
jgi:hypothetical protein